MYKSCINCYVSSRNVIRLVWFYGA